MGGVKGTKYLLKIRNHAPRTTRYAPRTTENQKQCPSAFLRKVGGQLARKWREDGKVCTSTIMIDLGWAILYIKVNLHKWPHRTIILTTLKWSRVRLSMAATQHSTPSAVVLINRFWKIDSFGWKNNQINYDRLSLLKLFMNRNVTCYTVHLIDLTKAIFLFPIRLNKHSDPKRTENTHYTKVK